MRLGENVETKKGLYLRRAQKSDMQELLLLYFTIYGNTYPLKLGTDREIMKSLIEAPQNLWLLAIDESTKNICGSIVFEVDIFYKIGRAEGMVVHPEYQKRGIASLMLSYGSNYLLEKTEVVNSIYTTTRTLSVGPQLAFLNDGYIPLGIFPNAHRLASYETLTLMAKYRSKVLSARRVVEEVPEALGPILKTLEKFVKPRGERPRLLPMSRPKATGPMLEFEFIHAPHYVGRKFQEAITDPYDRFYPFHRPNFLISSKSGEIDIFAYYGEQDGYCTIVALTQPTWTLAGRMRPLLDSLRSYGVAYLEILLTTDNILSIETLLDVQFLPSAIYPAMMEYNGDVVDLVLLSRTMEPLNFHGMHVEKSFKPYIDQYVDLWKKMHLEVLGVFDE
jgi:GNAT superfamily N-acetyltransferase